MNDKAIKPLKAPVDVCKSTCEETIESEGEAERETKEQIAERAYELWTSEGCPTGRALDHWLQAEHEILAALQFHGHACASLVPTQSHS